MCEVQLPHGARAGQKLAVALPPPPPSSLACESDGTLAPPASAPQRRSAAARDAVERRAPIVPLTPTSPLVLGANRRQPQQQKGRSPEPDTFTFETSLAGGASRDAVTRAESALAKEESVGGGNMQANLRKLDKFGVALSTRKCELRSNAKSGTSFRYKRLGGVLWSTWIPLGDAVLTVPSQHVIAEGRGFDIAYRKTTHVFMACSTDTSVALKVALLRAKSSLRPAARASLQNRSLQRLSSESYMKGSARGSHSDARVKVGAGFLARGPVEILKMSTVIKGARSSFHGTLSGRSYIKRYFTLSHDGHAAMYMNEAEFEAMAAMAEARKRDEGGVEALGTFLDGMGVVEERGEDYSDGESEEEGVGGADAGAAAGADAPLPPGWTETLDEECGYPYYTNVATEEMTWDRPRGAARVDVTDPLKGIGTVVVPEGVSSGDSFSVSVGLQSSFTIVAPAEAGATIQVQLPASTEFTKSIASLKSWHVHQNAAKAYTQTFDLSRGIMAIARTGEPRELCLRGARFGKHEKIILRFQSEEDLGKWVDQVRAMCICLPTSSAGSAECEIPLISLSRELQLFAAFICNCATFSPPLRTVRSRARLICTPRMFILASPSSSSSQFLMVQKMKVASKQKKTGRGEYGYDRDSDDEGEVAGALMVGGIFAGLMAINFLPDLDFDDMEMDDDGECSIM